MGTAPNRETAYVWTAALANAIRAADPSRAIVSGMHVLSTPASSAATAWTIDDQGELTDLLTTHPYPYWTRFTRGDAVDSLRTTMHATAETRFYGDIGGKPSFAEEIGTMGPMVAGEAMSAAFARVNLFSLWANDCRGFLWWCAFDQTHLAHAPYDWNGVELELGLLRIDGTPKLAAQEMKAFREFLDTLPFRTLPLRRTEAVCLLTHGQDDWAAAYGAFTLSKQARLEIAFRHIFQELPDSPIYLLPSLKGGRCVPRRQWLALLEKVKAGATLYASLDDGILPHFNEVAGVELLRRSKFIRPTAVKLSTALGDETLTVATGDYLEFANRNATVLATREDGAPFFWRHAYGQGQVLIFAAPAEVQLATTPGNFVSNAANAAAPWWRIYAEIARAAGVKRAVASEAPEIAVTEHVLPDGRVAVVAINHTPVARSVDMRLNVDAKLRNCWRGRIDAKPAGDGFVLHLPASDAVVFAIQ
jgi:hypothetical protein